MTPFAQASIIGIPPDFPELLDLNTRIEYTVTAAYAHGMENPSRIFRSKSGLVAVIEHELVMHEKTFHQAEVKERANSFFGN